LEDALISSIPLDRVRITPEKRACGSRWRFVWTYRRPPWMCCTTVAAWIAADYRRMPNVSWFRVAVDSSPHNVPGLAREVAGTTLISRWHARCFKGPDSLTRSFLIAVIQQRNQFNSKATFLSALEKRRLA
jgi:hypothetical protein